MDAHAANSHFTLEDFERYLCEQFDVKNASEFRSHIQKCADCENRLLDVVARRLTSSANSGESKRSESRVPTTGSGWLQALSPLSLERLSAKLADTSAHGCSLIVPVPLQPGTIVSLGIGAAVSVGAITYCDRTEDGEYRIGIERKSDPKRTNLASATNLRW